MSYLWRLMVVFCAIGLIGAVVASAERSRPGSTPLGRALGVASAEARLAAIADAKILRRVEPAPADLAFARRVARTAPLSPLPFYILAVSGQARDPVKAVGEALRRDPRLRPAYSWQAEHDARAGDIAGATRALIHLASLSPGEDKYWAAIVQLTADPTARAAIKQDLMHTPAPTWREGYLAQLGASGVDRGVVFEMLQTSGKHADVTAAPLQPGTPDDRRAFIAAMIARKDYERAYLAWVQWLPAASQSAVGRVFDGDFKGAAALQPFAWELSNGVGGATAIDRAAGLTLDYSGTVGATLAHQMLLLAPGRYRIVTQARFDSVATDGGTPPLVWSLTCIADGRVLAELAMPLDGVARRIGSGAFALADGCPAQTLELRVNPADFTKRISGQVRSVAIEAVK